jgi:hypothetical protein
MREQGADDVVLDTIIMIPSQEYRNPDAVFVEIEASVLGATLASPMRTIALPSGGPDPGLRTERWLCSLPWLACFPGRCRAAS